MTLTYHPYDARFVARVRGGGRDDYGNLAERAPSDGGGNPCRSCLQDIPAGEDMLIVAARPFPVRQPYAETGPIFLCARDCMPYAGCDLPPVLDGRADALVKGYGADHRIIYGTGAIVKIDQLKAACETILSNAKVAFVDVRSSRNNCFTFRITRGNRPF